MQWRTPYEACPLCLEASFKHLRDGDCTRHPLYQSAMPPTMAWMQCDACGHVFAEGPWTKEALAIVFAKTHENQKPGFDFEGQRPVASRMVEKVTSAGVNDGPWLDVGFGNGALLFAAAEYGFDPVGLELRKDSAETMSRIGVESHCISIDEFKPDKEFSVISMADVLEHTEYPTSSLRSARSIIRDNGVLLLSMPNSESPLWQMMDLSNANPYWGEIEHYHNFSRSRLYSLLRHTGFDPIRYGISERYRACMEIVSIAK